MIKKEESKRHSAAIDIIDMKILKIMFNDVSDLYYIKDLLKQLDISERKLRLRLKKLCERTLIKEVKSYPSYYLPNKMLKEKVEEIKVPLFQIK